MNLTALITLPLILLTQGYTLILTTKNGNTVEYQTDEIEKMEFVNNSQPGEYKLATPDVKVTTDGTNASFSWNKVENATSYRQQLDGEDPVVNNYTSASFMNLSVGTHIFSVTAVSSDSQYSDSNPGSVTFEIYVPVAETKQFISVNSVTSKTINTKIDAISEPHYIGIVPRSREFTPDADLIKAVNSNGTRKELPSSGSSQTITFDGLNPDTNYIIVAFSKDESEVMRYFTRTYIDLTPGTKGTVWAPGVDENSGFIDVNKVGDLGPYGWTLYVDETTITPGDIPSNDDSGHCWACTASGLIQWWLNDYKSKTGHDYPLRYPGAIPEKSKCYSTPIMDMMNDAFGWNEGASCHDAIKWFFAGYYDHPVVGNPTNPQYCNTVGAPHRPDYQYWKGGFLGMTFEEAQSYIVSNPEANDGFNWYNHNMYYSCSYSIPKDATADEAAAIFTNLNIDAFMQGPVNIHFSKHSMSAWGADYEVLADGTPRITRIRYCENAIHSSNVIDGLQAGNDGNIEYKPASYPSGLVGKNLPLIQNSIGGQYTLLNCNGLRGWQPK